MVRAAKAVAPVTDVPVEDPFGSGGTESAATPPLPPVNAQELINRLTQLQRDVAAADRERASAETSLAQAKKDLAEIDAHLKALKVDPETAAEALAALEQELLALTTQFENTLKTERAAYQQIAAAQ